MDIPKSFRPEQLKEIDFKDLKNHMPSIEDLIIDENLLGYNRKEVYELGEKHYDCHWVIEKGVVKAVEKMIMVEYYDDLHRFGQTIFVFQYKTKNGLTNNLRNIFEKGVKNNSTNKIKFTERFFFKDKISVYLDNFRKDDLVDELFVKKARDYYRNLGFKQLDFKLVGV